MRRQGGQWPSRLGAAVLSAAGLALLGVLSAPSVTRSRRPTWARSGSSTRARCPGGRRDGRDRDDGRLREWPARGRPRRVEATSAPSATTSPARAWGRCAAPARSRIWRA